MKKIFISIVCYLGVVLFSILSLPKVAIAVEFTPFHLFDGYYNWNSQVLPDGHYNSDINLTINEEPPTGSYYYWSNNFYFVNGEVGYTGLQSNGWMWNEGWVGKMVIFSIWNALDSQAGNNAVCGKFDGEGEGLSCRMKYDWQSGHTYRLRIWKTDTSWWAAFIMDITTGKEDYIGKIKVSKSWKGLTNNFVLFSEYFGKVSSCDAIPYTKVTFSNPMADNGTYTAKLNNKRFHQKCSSIVNVTDSNNSWHIETGKVNTSSYKTLEEKSNAIFDKVENAYGEYFSPSVATKIEVYGSDIIYFRTYDNEYQSVLATYQNSVWYSFYGNWIRYGTLDEANQQLCNNQCWAKEMDSQLIQF